MPSFSGVLDVFSVDWEAVVTPRRSQARSAAAGRKLSLPWNMSAHRKAGRLALAEMMHSHGANRHLGYDLAGKPREHAGEHSKDFKAIRAAARREAEAMLDDATLDNALDTRIVNNILGRLHDSTPRVRLAGLCIYLWTIRDAGENSPLRHTARC